MIIWNLVIEQRDFKGTKMTFKQSQCLFVLVLFSNIPRNINYKLTALVFTTMIVLPVMWGVQDMFSPFFLKIQMRLVDTLDGLYEAKLTSGKALVGGLHCPGPCEGTFCPAVGL